MSINPLKLTRGFGNGTFSGIIARRVAQGFAIGEEAIIIAPPPPSPQRTHLTQGANRVGGFTGLNRKFKPFNKNRSLK